MRGRHSEVHQANRVTVRRFFYKAYFCKSERKSYEKQTSMHLNRSPVSFGSVLQAGNKQSSTEEKVVKEEEDNNASVDNSVVAAGSKNKSPAEEKEEEKKDK